MKIGCHISIAGGIFNAPANAQALGCEVFQVFSRSPRGGPAAKLTKEVLSQYFAEMKKYGFAEMVIHTPYYINFGSKNKAIAMASARIVREELERATMLKSPYIMTHMGSYKDLGREKGFDRLIEGIEKILKGYKGSAMLLLEIAAGAGEQMGGRFDEMGKILRHPKLKKYKIGVCFDTCHAFASGYDLRTSATVNSTLKELDKQIGLENLKVIHANDSKFALGEHRDRHEHIGMGKIGLEGFKAIVKHPKLKKLNLYLETEHDKVKDDIKILKKLRV